jgi:hypothetical protein
MARCSSTARSSSRNPSRSLTPSTGCCETPASCCRECVLTSWSAGAALDQPRGVRVHQEGRLRAGAARAQRVHGLRPWSDEGPDEGRHHRPHEAAPPRGRYLGLPKPGIVAAEPPNPIVNHL